MSKNYQQKQRVNRHLNAIGWLYVIGVICATCATVASVCVAALCFFWDWLNAAFVAVACGCFYGLLSVVGAIYGANYLEDRTRR